MMRLRGIPQLRVRRFAADISSRKGVLKRKLRKGRNLTAAVKMVQNLLSPPDRWDLA